MPPGGCVNDIEDLDLEFWGVERMAESMDNKNRRISFWGVICIWVGVFAPFSVLADLVVPVGPDVKYGRIPHGLWNSAPCRALLVPKRIN